MSTEVNTGLNNKCEIINKKQTDSIKCSDCKKELLVVYQNKIFKESLYNIVVQCPFCGDKSYNYEIFGDMKYVLPEKVKVIDIVSNEKTKTSLWKTKKG